MYDVITIGSATRDVFLKSKDFLVVSSKNITERKAICFPLGSKNEIDEVVLSTGGGATNAAVTFARQGFKTACIARVGSDSFAHNLLLRLKEDKVSTEFIQEDKKPETGYSVIVTTPEGSRAILVRRGVSAGIKASEINFKKVSARWLYITSLAGNLTLLSKLLNYAKKNNIKVALDPGTKELRAGIRKLGPLLKKVDFLKMNQDEAAMLLGIDFKKEKEIFKKLSKLTGGIVAMTKGSGGVVVSDGENIYSAGVPKSPIIERTGAGDAFGSGFLSAILRGKDVSDAIVLGTANSTSVIQYYSAKTGILKKGSLGKYPKVKVSIKKYN